MGGLNELIARSAPSSDPRWLSRLREEARERFTVLGLPTSKNEEWKYTSLSALSKLEFGTSGAQASFEPLAIAPAARVVFVDGALDRAHSDFGKVTGLTIQPIAQALEDASLEKLLTAYELVDGVRALNTAAFTDGVRIRVARGTRVEGLIQIVSVTRPGGASVLRHVIELESGAEAQVVEEFAAERDASRPGFTSSVTQVTLAAAARLSHVRFQGEGPANFHLSDLQSDQSRDSLLESIWVSLGAMVARNEIHSRLGEENAEVRLIGLYAGSGKQQVDAHTVIDHASPHCRSEEVYKGVLADEARGAFTGRIIVRKDAQKTDSRQINRNLLLSERAIADTRPQLQIHADDVKCSHGAAIGRLDEEQLYYLRSRGIGVELARKLVSRAFAGEVLDRIPGEKLRENLATKLDHWLGNPA